MSSEIKYVEYAKLDQHSREHLYRHKVLLPGPVIGAFALAVLGWWGFAAWSPFADHMSDAVKALGASVLVVLVLLTGISIVITFLALSENEPRIIFFMHYINEKELPYGFEKKYIKEPEYQTVLADYMRGLEIDSLYPLNELLDEKYKLEEKTFTRPKSDIVKVQTEALEAYISGLKEVKKNGGSISK